MATKVTYTLEVDASGAKNALSSTSAEAKKTAKTFDELEKETNEASKAQSEFGQTSAGASNLFGSALKAVGIDVSKFTGGLDKANKVKKAATVSTKALTIAMLALPIIAIAAAFLTLFKAFTSTQEGADRLNRILVPLRVVFETLWGRVQELSIALVDAFTSPQDALKAFGGLIVSQVVNRFTGLFRLIPALGEAISLAFSGNFKGAAKVAGDAILQIATGVEGVIGKVSEFGAEVASVMGEAIERGNEIQAIEEQIRQLRIDQAVPLRQLNREFQELNTLARDQTKSEEDRLKAADEAIAKRRQIRDMELELVDLEIRKLELQQESNDTSDAELLQLEELRAKREDITAAAIAENRRIETTRNAIFLAIQKEGEAEAENEEKRRVALTERADQYRDLLKTEEELTQEAFDKELEQLAEFYEQKILSDKEYAEIRALIEQGLMDELERIRAAKTAKVEEQDNKEELSSEELKKARIDNELEILGATIGAQAAQARSFKEATKGIITEYLRRLAAAVFTLVASKIPPPFGVVAGTAAAGLATAAARRIVGSVPGFRDGGLTPSGRRVIEVNEDGGRPEFVVNADATAANLPLLQAINSGASLSGGAMFNDGGFADKMGGVASKMENISISLDLEDVIRTIDDRTRINTERNINTP